MNFNFIEQLDIVESGHKQEQIFFSELTQTEILVRVIVLNMPMTFRLSNSSQTIDK